jgi:hypothetical protein
MAATAGLHIKLLRYLSARLASSPVLPDIGSLLQALQAAVVSGYVYVIC